MPINALFRSVPADRDHVAGHQKHHMNRPQWSTRTAWKHFALFEFRATHIRLIVQNLKLSSVVGGQLFVNVEEMNMKKTENGIPRRDRLDLNSDAELMIRNVIMAVEHLGANPLLTDAIVLLGQARGKVADYVERCSTCDGARRIKSSSPLKDKAFMVPCPDCTHPSREGIPK